MSEKPLTMSMMEEAAANEEDDDIMHGIEFQSAELAVGEAIP